MRDVVDQLQIFRALKSEIRSSPEYLIIGIDVGKDKHHAFFGTASGKTLRRKFVFQNRLVEFERLRTLAADLGKQHGLKKRVYGLEPTGVYHKPLAEFLQRKEDQVVLVSNVAVQRNRELLDGRWDKNDVNDPANVADLVGQGRCLWLDQAEGDLRELRSLLSLRAALRKDEHITRMRIRNHLIAQYFPELEAGYASGGSDQLVVRVLEQCFDPAEIAQLDFEAFWNRVAKPRWGKRQPPRMRAVWQGAQESVGCRMDEAVRWQAPLMAATLKLIRDRLQDCEGRIRTVAQRLPGYRSVRSIPGIGPAVAAMILAAIGDPWRFDHPRQVLRLAGLDLCASKSGKRSERVIPKISKQGKPMLRFALVQAARVAARSDDTVRRYFSQRLEGREQERGIRLKRTVKLAAKLLVIAWTLMRNGESFDPSRFTA
jgi:transposase